MKKHGILDHPCRRNAETRFDSISRVVRPLTRLDPPNESRRDWFKLAQRERTSSTAVCDTTILPYWYIILLCCLDTNPHGDVDAPLSMLVCPMLPPQRPSSSPVYNKLREYDECIDSVGGNYTLDWGGDIYWWVQWGRLSRR